MTKQESLVEALKESLKGQNCKLTIGAKIYNHVHLEINEFILPDYLLISLIETAREHQFGFYLTPRFENERETRHTITFHT